MLLKSDLQEHSRCENKQLSISSSSNLKTKMVEALEIQLWLFKTKKLPRSIEPKHIPKVWIVYNQAHWISISKTRLPHLTQTQIQMLAMRTRIQTNSQNFNLTFRIILITLLGFKKFNKIPNPIILTKVLS